MQRAAAIRQRRRRARQRAPPSVHEPWATVEFTAEGGYRCTGLWETKALAEQNLVCAGAGYGSAFLAEAAEKSRDASADYHVVLLIHTDGEGIRSYGSELFPDKEAAEAAAAESSETVARELLAGTFKVARE